MRRTPEQHNDCRMLKFPFDRRVGRIRDVAQKWIAKPRAADKRGYETIVAKATRGSLERAGFTDDQIDAELVRFWNEVQAELNRIYADPAPDGAA